MNKFKKLTKELVSISLIAVLIMVFGFSYVEPNLVFSIEDQHTIKQTVTAEITFAATAADVVMAPTIGGITGGTGNGATQFRIVSNNTTGFSVTLAASSSIGMIGDDKGSASGTIPVLDPAIDNTPDFTFDTAAVNSAAFAYTIKATTSTDVAARFLDSGAACNTGSNMTENRCWLNSSTSAVTIINRTTATQSSGATSTLYYRAIISANPQPLIPENTYTSTTTITATNN